MAEFTHLHLHTEYSLLDGACDVYKLVDRVAALGQKSVAMTDHGNIYGAVHFFDAAKAKGVAYPSIAVNSKIDALRGLHRYREALALADEAAWRQERSPFLLYP